MKILLLVHNFNSLSQRLFVELREAGHEVSVEFDINDLVSMEAVDLFKPDLLIAPFLKRAIPESIWGRITCLVVHPGPPGNRGPSALDWAILNGEKSWGVTLLQANGVLDGGDIWASETFPMRTAPKGSLYRNEVTEAAVTATLRAVNNFTESGFRPQTQWQLPGGSKIESHPLATGHDRLINWEEDGLDTVVRKIHSADGAPGVPDHLFRRDLSLYDVQPEFHLSGKAGAVIARSGPAICRATADGKAVWIGRLRDRESNHPFKLPATTVLADEIAKLPEVTVESENSSDSSGYREISYEQIGDIGLLHFSFYNGAMGATQCQQLLSAYRHAREQNSHAIVLLGGEDYWSNGMDLNQIEAAESTADESWKNINVLDDLALEIINTDDRLTISALQGGAGAGGVFLARTADFLWARDGVILNPHYKDMGNLYGSEYWSYLLPRYTGRDNAEHIIRTRLPMGTAEAERIGLVDAAYGANRKEFIKETLQRTKKLVVQPGFEKLLEKKRRQRSEDEAIQPLATYREQELEKMRMNFYGFDPSYHIARYNFIHKIPKSRTPLTLALHRRTTKSWA